VCLDQEAKSLFHGRFLGRGSAPAHRLPHQGIIDLDICSHRRPPDV
jgi:hypothetical protein